MIYHPHEQFRSAILAAGLTPPDEIIPDGRIHRFPSNGRRGDMAGWYQLFTDGRAGVFGDFRRGLTSVWIAGQRERMTRVERADFAQQLTKAKAQRQERQRQQQAVNSKRNAALWAETLSVTDGDPVALYLSQRGLAGPVPKCLRLHPGLTYWDGENCSTWPAMVAPLIGADGLVRALHRTYLTADGCKAAVPTVKKLTGTAGSLAGAYIPLHDAQSGVIGIAEGIETAQAAHLASGLPTVAAYCAGNLAAYVWPMGINRIVVFADADPVGEAATQRLKARAVRAGLSVVVMTPSTPGADWCDVWAQRGVLVANASEAEAWMP